MQTHEEVVGIWKRNGRRQQENKGAFCLHECLPFFPNIRAQVEWAPTITSHLHMHSRHTIGRPRHTLVARVERPLCHGKGMSMFSNNG
jgi:hypothetical protein